MTKQVKLGFELGQYVAEQTQPTHAKIAAARASGQMNDDIRATEAVLNGAYAVAMGFADVETISWDPEEQAQIVGLVKKHIGGLQQLYNEG